MRFFCDPSSVTLCLCIYVILPFKSHPTTNCQIWLQIFSFLNPCLRWFCGNRWICPIAGSPPISFASSPLIFIRSLPNHWTRVCISLVAKVWIQILKSYKLWSKQFSHCYQDEWNFSLNSVKWLASWASKSTKCLPKEFLCDAVELFGSTWSSKRRRNN